MSDYITPLLIKINSYISFNTLCIISCIILVVLLLNALQIRNIERQLLTGFWKADGEFCNNAGIKSMLIYLGNSDNTRFPLSLIKSLSNYKIPGYILLENNEGLIINNPVKIHIILKYDLSQEISDYQIYQINIDWLEETDYEMFFPSSQTLYYYPQTGKLTFMQNDQIYAILFKDCSLTDSTQKNNLRDSTYSIIKKLKNVISKRKKKHPPPALSASDDGGEII